MRSISDVATRSAIIVAISTIVVIASDACRRSDPDQQAPVETPSAPADSADQSRPGSLIVVKAGDDVQFILSTDQPGVNFIPFQSTNQPIALTPGDYTISVNNSKTRRTIRAGERTTVTIGSVLMVGMGTTQYGIFDTADTAVAYPRANEPIDLVPGDFTIRVNGSKSRISVLEGQRTTVSTGSIVVTGIEGGEAGTRNYRVRDTSQQILTAAPLNEPRDLLPGDYVVDLHGSSAPQSVRVGQRSTVNAGSFVVASKTDAKSFFLRTPGETAAWGIGDRVHLLPGRYELAVEGTPIPFTIAAGQATTVR